MAAETRDRLGDPQRVAGADRLAQLDVVDHARRKRHRLGPEPVDHLDLVVEDADQLGIDVNA